MYLQIEKGHVICCSDFYHTLWISGLKSLGIESVGRNRVRERSVGRSESTSAYM